MSTKLEEDPKFALRATLRLNAGVRCTEKMRALLLLLLAGALGGCGKPTGPIDRTGHIKPDGMQSRDQFVKSTHFPYEPAPSRRQQIIDGLTKATPCLSKNEVQALLGNPDYSDLMCPKDPHQKCTGTAWKYFLKTRDGGSPGVDSIVIVFFSVNDRARWFASENVQGAREVGNVNEQCT